MHDDEPDDLVHDVLRRGAVPRPPARPRGRSGRQDTHRRDARATRSPPSTPTTTARRTSSSRRPANVDHDEVVDGVDADARPTDGRARPARAGGADTADADRFARVDRPTGAGAPRGRGPRPPAATTRPLRPRGPQPGARRRHVEPAVPGDPREAGPGLLGVLVPQRVRGDGFARGLRRHRAGAGRRDARRRPRRARPAGRRRRHHRPGARRGQGAPHRVAGAVAGELGEPHEPHRAQRAHARARSRASTGWSSRSTRSPRTTSPGSSTGCSARARARWRWSARPTRSSPSERPEPEPGAADTLSR